MHAVSCRALECRIIAIHDPFFLILLDIFHYILSLPHCFFCSPISPPTEKPGTCSTSQLEYTLTNAGTKASFPSEDCTNPSVIIPGLDNPYRALQLHIHAGSEHTIDGKFFGAELHIVHEEIGGDRFAVVGMMIEPGSDVENEFFQQLLDGWQREFDTVDDSCAVERATTGKRRRRDLEMVGDNTTGNRRLEAFSPYDLLPEGVTYYHYDGGLTTPPCLEVVWWNVADKPVLITPAQYQQLLQQILNFVDASTCNLGTNAGPRGITSRPVQALNGRLVERVCPVGFEEDKSCDESNDDTVDGEEVDSRSASAPMLAMRVMTSSVVVALVVMLSMM